MDNSQFQIFYKKYGVGTAVILDFIQADLGVNFGPNFLEVTPRFGSAATAVEWAKMISG